MPDSITCSELTTAVNRIITKHSGDESRITESEFSGCMDDLTPEYAKYEPLCHQTFSRKLAEEFVAFFATSLQTHQ